MKRLFTLTALLTVLGMHLNAHAGLFSFRADCGADKADCAADKPDCGADKAGCGTDKANCGADKAGCKSDGCSDDCTKTVKQPCEPQVFDYQRKKSTAPAPACGADGTPDCAPDCPPASGPADASCAAPESGDDSAACAPAASDGCGATACCNGSCSKDDACTIAELIFASQTECYAKDRARAIDRLGDSYSCVCHPEIMAAFMYSLNDADERVRAEAADEIGDQARAHGCSCASERVIEGLTFALGDCDLTVRRQASEALQVCGYCIEDCAPNKPECELSVCNILSALKSGISLGGKCGASGNDAGACGTDKSGACGADSSAACGASGAACGAAGTATPAEAGAGDGESGLSPSAVDSVESAPEPKAVPAPPEEETKPAKPDYEDKAKPAAPPKADDKTAGQLKKRSVLSRLFGIIRR